MTKTIKIKWSFIGTEFEEVAKFQYNSIIDTLGLPVTYELDEEDEEDEVADMLFNMWGFEVDSWSYD